MKVTSLKTQAAASLIYDTKATPPFGGACGIVSLSLRKAAKDLGYRVNELYCPLSDKSSEIIVPKLQVGTHRNVRIIFEELYQRCKKDSSWHEALNVVMFNLRYLNNLKELCEADAFIFQSKFMMRCFKLETSLLELKPPFMAMLPLPLPLTYFPQGYPSYGNKIDRAYLNRLRKEVYLGHAIRPRKMDPFATLSIVFHLNRISEKKNLKPFNLVVSEADYTRLSEALDTAQFSKNIMDYFIAVDHVSNRSLTYLVKQCHFALCYDEVVENYGYYPVESVYNLCPVFTNGSGNLRHLLPKNHGIEVHETVGMHFGSHQERVNAYEAVAERIIQTITRKQSKDCMRGKEYLLKMHSHDVFSKLLGKFIKRATELKANPSTLRRIGAMKIKPSPYLRLADWKNGQFVTDLGVFKNEKLSQDWFKKIGKNMKRIDRSNMPDFRVIDAS